jgi:tetratricopeptide (TPR) repeat protein
MAAAAELVNPPGVGVRTLPASRPSRASWYDDAPTVICTGQITMGRLFAVLALAAACAQTPVAEPEVHAIVIEPTPPPEDQHHEEPKGLSPIIEEAIGEEAEPEVLEREPVLPAPPPPAHASAQPSAPPPPAPPPTAVLAARQAFQEGIAAYQAGDYALALRHFERAHGLAPLPQMFQNMAMAALEAGDKAKACRYYAEGTRQGNRPIEKLDQSCNP